MKNIKSKQTKAFDSKNALRAFGGIPKFADGGVPLGANRARQMDQIDAEAVRGTALEVPPPSITAPPPAAPAPAPGLMTRAGMGVQDAISALTGRATLEKRALSGLTADGKTWRNPGDPMTGFAAGGSVYQTEPTAALPTYPTPHAARGGPSPLRLGAAGVPGFPPAFAQGGALPPPNTDMFEEGGPITAHHPAKQGKDEQVVLAAAGEYILPKATVDAMGGPDHLDELVRQTNGKEPNNSNGSPLRAATGALVPYNPVVGQAFGAPAVPELGTFRPGEAGYAKANQAINSAEGAAGNRSAELAKHALRQTLTPQGFGARMVAGGAGLAARAIPYAAPVYGAQQAVKGFNTPTENYDAAMPTMARILREGANVGLRNTPFVGPAINALFPQTPAGNEGVGDLAVRGAGLVGNATGVIDVPAGPKKTEITTSADTKNAAAANALRVQQQVPKQAGPQYAKLGNAFEGVNLGDLSRLTKALPAFAQIQKNKSDIYSAKYGNELQRALAQQAFERQRFGIEYTTKRHDENRAQAHAAIEAALGKKDKETGAYTPESAAAVAQAKLRADKAAHERYGGYQSVPQAGLSSLHREELENSQRDAENAGPLSKLKTIFTGTGQTQIGDSAEDYRPTGPVKPGVLVDTVPTGVGELPAPQAKGQSGTLWGSGLPRKSRVEDVAAANAKGGRITSYAKGGRVSKSKLRQGPC